MTQIWSNTKPTDAEIRAVHTHCSTQMVRECNNDVERAFFLHNVLGVRKCAIIAAHVVSLNQWKRGKATLKKGHQLGKNGQPEYFSSPHKSLLLENHISSFTDKQTKPTARKLTTTVCFCIFIDSTFSFRCLKSKRRGLITLKMLNHRIVLLYTIGLIDETIYILCLQIISTSLK